MWLLDLCCGHGRHAIPLAQRGLKVVCQDLSPHQLERARTSAGELGVELEIVQRDMRDIRWSGRFDAVINLFSAFGFFPSDEDNIRVLEGVAGALKPGGRLLLDTRSYEHVMRTWQPHGYFRGEGDVLVLEDRKMDWMRGIEEVERTHIEADGRRWKITLRLRLFPAHELVDWLARAGLEAERLFGSYAGAPFGLDAERLIIVARKPWSGED